MTLDAESKKVVITRLDRVIQNNVDARVEHGHDGFLNHRDGETVRE
ncbi:MAG: hypothetical protein OXH94_00455 [Rhodospirillales bacterium]|nr:hypothetical protein [Rhodospirillales bacterium]